jgi:hypothetical protein
LKNRILFSFCTSVFFYIYTTIKFLLDYKGCHSRGILSGPKVCAAKRH